MTESHASGPGDYLAAERTFLAWIRTGLSLMGFGFVVARFGLFLQTLQIANSNLRVPAYGNSFWFGTTLILLGVVVNVLCTRSYLRLVRELRRGGTGYQRPSALGIAVAIALALFGLAMAIYLFSVSHVQLSVSQVQPRDPREPEERSMNANPGTGIITIASHQSVDGTVEKLRQILQTKGVKLFALVDHSGEAEKAGLEMLPTKLLIFGNPKAGTPLMVAAPSIAIDLPLKILIWEDHAGKVWISYNDPSYLQMRHGVAADLMANIAVIEGLAEKAAER